MRENTWEARSAARWPDIGPETAIRNDFDARTLAVLWAARKTFLPLVWLGTSIAIIYFIIVRDPSAFVERIGLLNSPGDLAGAVLSPFTGVVIAIMTRITVALLALAAAYPLTTINSPDDYPDTHVIGRYWRMWWDRWQMSRAYRAVRWSWTVRRAVLHRLDASGSIFRRWDLLMLWANVLLFILCMALFVVLAQQIET